MGEWKNKIQGKAEELKGDVTGDRSEKMKGKARRAWGDVQGKANDIKDSFEDQQDREAGVQEDPTAINVSGSKD